MLPIRVVLAPLLVTVLTNNSLSSPMSQPVRSGTTSGLPEAVVQNKVGEIRPANKEDLANLKKLDQKYQSSKSISMDLEKSLKLAVLEQERKTKGRLLISQGRLRMETEKPDQSLVVVDKKNIWVVQFPPEELKKAPLQVIRASADTKKGRSQSFIGLLVKGGILKYFKVLNTQTNADSSTTYFLQPEKGSVEFARAQVVVDKSGEQITSLKYWDELSNETTFSFSNIAFNKKISASQFTYAPPKNAEVTSY